MKTETDNNITSSAGYLRRDAFKEANLLVVSADVKILLDGNVYSKIEPRLNDDHKAVFKSLYSKDNSAVGVPGFNIYESIAWVAKSESKSRRVILLTDNTSQFASICNEKIVVVSVPEFLDKIRRAKYYYINKFFTSLDDSLMAVFFLRF